MTADLNVRKMAGTTASIIVLLLAWQLVVPWLWSNLPTDIVMNLRLRLWVTVIAEQGYVGIMVVPIWVMVVASTIDAMLRHRGIGVTSAASFFPLLTLGGVIVILGMAIPLGPGQMSQQLTWALAYVAAIVGVFWMSRKIATICHPGQKLLDFLKSIPAFGGTSTSHPVDRYFTFAVAVLLLAYDVVLTIQAVVYVVNQWQWLFG